MVKTKNAVDTKEDLQNLMSFLTVVTSISYNTNSDGDGIYVDGIIAKSKEKINLLKFHKECYKSDIILTHQRYATSGKTVDMTQPFENSEFVLAHNGIINDFLGNEGSDTFGFFNQFTKKFNEFTTGTREEKIINVIKNLLENLTGGSYSIALVDKKTNYLYYFKDSYTTIHAGKSKDFLFLTTKAENLEYLKLMTTQKFSKHGIKPYRIYRIKVDEKIKIEQIGKIHQKEKEYTYKVTNWNNSTPITRVYNMPDYGRHYTTDIRREEEDKSNMYISEIEKEMEFEYNGYSIPTKADCVIVANPEKCAHCTNITHNMHPTTFARICNDCLEEGYS